MYLKILKTSDTGKKFQALLAKSEECIKVRKDFLLKLNASGYCEDRWAVFGGCEVVCFEETPDLKIWKRIKEVKNGYQPKLTSKKGVEINKEMINLPSVSRNELNSCIGFDDEVFSCIGFNWQHPNYFAVKVDETWDIEEIPSDCEEILYSEYMKMFENNG